MARTISAILNLKDNFSNTLRNTTNNTKQFQRQLKQVGNTAKQMKSAVVGSLAGMVAGVGILELGRQSVMLASDLQEVANVVDVTFGDGAKTINTWSQNALKSFGLSELQAKKFNGTLGALMKSSGISGDKLLEMSTGLSGLSADFASFYNLAPEEAFDKIKSGISGETEPLKALGINMSVANMEAYALTQGITKQWKEMSQAEQVTLRYGYLMKSSADAQGDFARTSKGFANQLRIAKTTLQQVGATIASYVLPFLNKLLIGFNDGLSFMPAVIDGFKSLVGQLMKVSSVKEGLYLIFITLNGYISKLFPNVSETFSRIHNIVAEVVGGILDNVIRIGGELATPFMEAFNSIKNLVGTVGGTILDLFSSITTNGDMSGMFNGLRDVLAVLLSDITGVFNFFNDNWSIIAPIISGVGGAILAFTAIVKGMELAIIAVKAVQTAWAVVTDICTIAVGLLNGTLAVSPLGWVAIAIGAVIAVGVALWQNWDFICAKAGELWNYLTTAFSGIGESISGVFSGIGSAISGFINYAIGGINSLIDGLNSLGSFTLPDWLPEVGGKSFSLNIPHVPNFATGTQYFKGGLAEMNEHGGEMAIMPNGSKIIPSDKTDKLLNGAGASPTVNVIVQGNVIGNEQFINEIGQVITNKVKVALINA